MKVIRYLFALLRIKVTKDYGMCHDAKSAKKCIKEYYFGSK